MSPQNPLTKSPVVSVIVPTRNNEATLAACLESIKAQTYAHIELIVVDNHSTDQTPAIATRYTTRVYHYGPERSAQRNFGAARATGRYLLMIDSDMELAPEVVASCVGLATRDPQLAAITIPEESFGPGFWSQCKALERSYYNGVSWMESPRFFARATFHSAGGYDEAISGGEDWDLTHKLRALGSFGRIIPLIRHNEGRIHLRTLLRKRFYYAQGFSQYYNKGASNKYADVFRVYALYLSSPRRFFRHPIRWLGMIFLKTAEFAALAAGQVKEKIAGRRRQHA